MYSAGRWRDMTPAGFPHSEISGSTPACDSPELFAANHVLHRLLTPRHSPCARSSLVTNLCGTLGGFHTSDARSGRQSLPSLGLWCWNPPLAGTMNVSASLLSLSRYAVYKVECSKNIRSPLTLDCVVRSSCASNDVLKTRFRVVVFY
jgi:hypothetical protein